MKILPFPFATRFAGGVSRSLLCLSLASAALLAQEPAPSADPLPGHSVHGESFNEGPRQAAYLMGTTGNVHFPVTTRSEEAQRFFDQGVGQLHGFWYFEAERSFRQVLQIDPECGMAYWGMAKANVNNDERAAKLIAQAAPFLEGDRLTEREKVWIRSLAEYYRDLKMDRKERARRLVRDLEAIVLDYPEDVEALAFLTVQIWANEAMGLPISSHLSVNMVLDRIFALDPGHPAHHYRIHLWDGEKPERAVASAARCGPAAPGIAHMWHMPGHTYSKLKRYHDAAWQQEASARVDHAHMMRDRVLPDQIHNYAHNNGWLVENLGFVGRVEDGISLAMNLVELPRLARVERLGDLAYYSGGGSYGEGQRRLTALLTDYQLWDRTLALGSTPYLEASGDPREQARSLVLQGVAHFWKEDLDGTRARLAELEALAADLKSRRQGKQEAAENEARAAGKEAKEIEEAGKGAGTPYDGHIGQIEEQFGLLQTYLAVAEKPASEARESLDKANGLSPFERARLFARMANWEKAEEILRGEVASGRHPVVARANHLLMLQQLGRKDEVRKEMEELRTLASAADLGLPPLAALQPIAKELGLPEDWRLPREIPSDLGERPDLDALGPFRWQPVSAPEWRLPQADGSPLALSDYRGRNVLVVFYLGRGCSHCMEQLNAFAPLAEGYRAAGIEIVGVSLDTPEGLQETVAGGENGGSAFPFPLVSDPELGVFRQYRAFDDFEEQPLHGTYLVDGEGRVRWQDISFEPFMEVAWLLEESKRLLGFDPSGSPVAAAPVSGAK